MKNHVAAWAGASAFFSSLLAIGVIDWIKPDNYVQFAGAIFIALVTGSAIYSKQKLEDARTEREQRNKESKS